MTRIAGVDDAGRGPIIGPLVMAGLVTEGDRGHDLVSMGVKDSKLLTPEQRTRLAAKIRVLASKISVVQVTPAEIDQVVLHARKLSRLNYLEAKVMAKVIEELSPEEAFVDASDVNENRFGEDIREFLPNDLHRIKIVSKHHADRTFPVVSAASIIAKTTRDAAVEALHREYGYFGSGYVTDPRTIDFLKEWRRTHDSYPPFVRLSWKTIKEIEREIGQSRLA